MSRMATKGEREVEDAGGGMSFRYPPGFRFHPTDEELVRFYLREKVNGNAMPYDVVADVDLYKCEPWELPGQSMLGPQDLEWFFFSPRDRKYPNGARTNRATRRGYWKATGRDRYVKTGSKTIGMKKTLVFYMGRAPQGERTDWLMHEYRLDGEEGESNNASQDAYVLCRVFKKNGVDVYKAPGSSGRDGHSSGPDGQDNNADSISDEQTSVFSEYEEKPSLELLPLPSGNSSQVAPLTAVPLDQQVMGALAVPVPLPPADGQPYFIGMENFDLDDISYKIDGISVDWLPDCAVADDNTDIMNNILENQTPQGLIQQDCGYAFTNHGGSFDDWDLPPLTEQQSPSPPMFPQDDCVGGDELSHNSTIQIRSRLPSSMRSPNPKALGGFTAPRFIKFGKRHRPSIAKDEHREVSEAGETSVPAEKECKPAKTESNVDGAPEIGPKACNSVTEVEKQEDTTESAGVVATRTPASILGESPVSSFEVDSLPDSVPSTAASETTLAPQCDEVEEQEAGSPSSSPPSSSTLLTKSNSNVDSLNQHPGMKSSVSNVDNQKSVAGMFHIKRYGELPPGIGSIHVNAVTISCSCDKVSVKPHAQATVCDCYNNSKLDNRQVLQGSGERDRRQGWENRRGGFWKGFIPVFLMGAVSACVGFLVVKRCVNIVTPVLVNCHFKSAGL